jgi:hypothetical protein
MDGIEDEDSAARPDEDNPELTSEELARAKPAAEVLPKLIGGKAFEELLAFGKRHAAARGLKQDDVATAIADERHIQKL